MKWIERADCRPPTMSTQPASTASSHGDIARPISTMSGSRMKMTTR